MVREKKRTKKKKKTRSISVCLCFFWRKKSGQQVPSVFTKTPTITIHHTQKEKETLKRGRKRANTLLFEALCVPTHFVILL